MTIHFCSLWDSRYGAQGVALYESLARHSTEPFTLWVLALDLETWQTLRLLELPHLHITPIESFVHEMNLAAVRANRTHQEWCWTLASQWCEYLLRRLPAVNYVDADSFFYSNPWPIFEEINVRSIAITPHRLIPSKKHLEVNGIYNVGFVHFKDTKAGRDCSSTWAAQCREWCYSRNEPSRFGDQKYLDFWPGSTAPTAALFRTSA